MLSRYRSAGPAVRPTLERVIAKGIAPSPDNKPLVIKFSRTLSEEDGVSIPDSEIYGRLNTQSIRYGLSRRCF